MDITSQFCVQPWDPAGLASLASNQWYSWSYRPPLPPNQKSTISESGTCVQDLGDSALKMGLSSKYSRALSQKILRKKGEEGGPEL